MIVGITGIGLIGGSLARAYKEKGHTVYVHDIDGSIVDYAVLAGVADGHLDDKTLPQCELLLVAIYPAGTEEYLQKAAPQLSRSCVVIDCCGTKRRVCETGFRLAAQYGFTFVGGHPMAGTQFSGFKHSRSDLFCGAAMVLCPAVHDDAQLLQRVKDLLAPCGFAHLSVTSPEEHDRIIAYTSQLAHVVSNAYIKSPTASDHAGFSAGSYQDLTRVAALNEGMWTDLFLENRDNLCTELDRLIARLTEARDALEACDAAAVSALLAAGSERKREVDGV